MRQPRLPEALVDPRDHLLAVAPTRVRGNAELPRLGGGGTKMTLRLVSVRTGAGFDTPLNQCSFATKQGEEWEEHRLAGSKPRAKDVFPTPTPMGIGSRWEREGARLSSAEAFDYQ